VKTSTKKKQESFDVSKCSIFNFSHPDIDNNFDEPELEIINSVEIEDRIRGK